MTVFAITYDLHKPKQDYESLIKKIKGYNTWSHRFDSFWLVETNNTVSASDIRDTLKNELDQDDSLIVVKLSGNWATFNVAKGGTDWLKNAEF
ncbi:MAG: hypothetical protein LKG24_01775 [Lacticaseibacillus songhuajiangensis]|nr:hypothetical protein [Lacticaseibacillus songhuajiangensis]